MTSCGGCCSREDVRPTPGHLARKVTQASHVKVDRTLAWALYTLQLPLSLQLGLRGRPLAEHAAAEALGSPQYVQPPACLSASSPQHTS